jgi:hypothetical protein
MLHATCVRPRFRLAGLALGVLLGVSGMAGSLAATVVGPTDGRLMRLVAFPPWKDQAASRAALWRAGLPIAAELGAGAFLIDGTSTGALPPDAWVVPIRTGADWGCRPLLGAST